MNSRPGRFLVPALLNTVALALAPAGAQAISPAQVESRIARGHVVQAGEAIEVLGHRKRR